MVKDAKCGECGLLAVIKSSSRGLEPADYYFRKTGTLPYTSQEDFDTRFEDLPICAGTVRDFGEMVAHHSSNQQGLVLQSLFSEDFDCPEFIRWRRGLSVEAHHQMIDRQRLQEFQTEREDAWQKFQTQMAMDDKKWREERAAEDKKWREQQAAEEKKWQAEQESAAESRHKTEMATMRGINRTQLWILGGCVILATLLGSVIQAGWFAKWFGL